MKLLFNNTDFLVVIGAKPFDNLVGAANCVLDYVIHLDTSVLKEALAEVNATVEVTPNESSPEDDSEDVNNGDILVARKLTLKSNGAGEFNPEDNDRLHSEWLVAFDSILRQSSIDYWNADIASHSKDE